MERQWQCPHCTFINSVTQTEDEAEAGAAALSPRQDRLLCAVCSKTATASEVLGPLPRGLADVRVKHPALLNYEGYLARRFERLTSASAAPSPPPPQPPSGGGGLAELLAARQRSDEGAEGAPRWFVMSAHSQLQREKKQQKAKRQQKRQQEQQRSVQPSTSASKDNPESDDGENCSHEAETDKSRKAALATAMRRNRMRLWDDSLGPEALGSSRPHWHVNYVMGLETGPSDMAEGAPFSRFSHLPFRPTSPATKPKRVGMAEAAGAEASVAAAATAAAECPLCLESQPSLLSMPLCGCGVCCGCLCQFAEVKLHEGDGAVSRLTCPVCGEPDAQTLADPACEYFPKLRSLLCSAKLKRDQMQLFDDRLRDWRLQRTSGFCWCSRCTFGFEVSEHYDRQVRCPQCDAHTCRKCGQEWHEKHRGISCEQFAAWRQQTDAGHRGLAEFLESRCSRCPNEKCGFRFELSRGGCLHLKCSQCNTEFCSDCNQLFVRNQCCQNKGLHCHHSADCVEAFRDWPIEKVRAAAAEAGVTLAGSSDAGASGGSCSVQEQKETEGGKRLTDARCGRPVCDSSGMCESHLKEALVSAMRRKRSGSLPQPAAPIRETEKSEKPLPALPVVRRSPFGERRRQKPQPQPQPLRMDRRVLTGLRRAASSVGETGGGGGGHRQLTCPHCTAVTPAAPRVSASRLLCTVCGKTCSADGAADDDDDGAWHQVANDLPWAAELPGSDDELGFELVAGAD